MRQFYIEWENGLITNTGPLEISLKEYIKHLNKYAIHQSHLQVWEEDL